MGEYCPIDELRVVVETILEASLRDSRLLAIAHNGSLRITLVAYSASTCF